MTDDLFFDERLTTVKELFKELIYCPAMMPIHVLTEGTIPPKTSGVYVFSEMADGNERYMYVGQSIGILERLREHCGRLGRKKANFAYMLTVESTGLKPIPYSPDNTKRRMFDVKSFKEGFDRSIERIESMMYRWVAVKSKLERNLLEIYAAVTLGARFNKFD